MSIIHYVVVVVVVEVDAMEHFCHKRLQVFSYAGAHCTHVKCIHLLEKKMQH